MRLGPSSVGSLLLSSWGKTHNVIWLRIQEREKVMAPWWRKLPEDELRKMPQKEACGMARQATLSAKREARV